MLTSGAFIKAGINIQVPIAEKEPREYTTGLYANGLDHSAFTAYMTRFITLFTKILQTSMTSEHQVRQKEANNKLSKVYDSSNFNIFQVKYHG